MLKITLFYAVLLLLGIISSVVLIWMSKGQPRLWKIVAWVFACGFTGTSLVITVPYGMDLMDYYSNNTKQTIVTLYENDLSKAVFAKQEFTTDDGTTYTNMFHRFDIESNNTYYIKYLPRTRIITKVEVPQVYEHKQSLLPNG